MSEARVSFAGSCYRMARTLIDRFGLRRSRAGRKLLGSLNTLGQLGVRLLVLRKGRTFMVDGHRMCLAHERGPSVAFAARLLQGRYEEETRNLFHRLIQRGMTVIDIGAHVGHYALLAARLVGSEGKVYAFEPDPDNYAILQKNVSLNGYTNIVAIPKAVSNRTGTLRLFVSRQGNDRHAIFENTRSIAREASEDVSSVSLDDFLAAQGWPQVDLIKMDIEGAEPLALEGMRGLLERDGDLKLVIEFAAEALRSAGFNPAEFLDRLAAAGLTVSPIEKALALVALRREDSARFVEQIEVQGVINLLCERTRSVAQARASGSGRTA